MGLLVLVVLQGFLELREQAELQVLMVLREQVGLQEQVGRLVQVE